jgi:hypothetical protein
MRRNAFSTVFLAIAARFWLLAPNITIWLAPNKRRELAGLKAVILYNPDYMSRKVSLEALRIPTLAEAY